MTQHERYAPHRARWSFALSAEGRAAIEGHLARGGALLGLHTASICFDDWPGWGGILGGAWRWGRSSHPPFGPVEVRLDARDHPLLAGLGDFELRDEVYGDLDLQPGLVPLAHARATGGGWHPVLWEREVGPGRVAYDALGHDVASLSHPVHRRIVLRAALRLCGLSLDGT
jgi:type 1 glutamine amidotransferase